MAKKTQTSFIGTVLNIFYGRDKLEIEIPWIKERWNSIEHWQDALELVAHLEIQSIGLNAREWAHNSELPPDDLIEESIASAKANDRNLEPRDCESYKLCFDIVNKVRFLRELVSETESGDHKFMPSSLEEVLSAGIELGLAAHLIGWEEERDFNIWMEQKTRPRKKRGKTYSLVRKALQALIIDGHDTGKRASAYLDTTTRIEGKAISVKRDDDRFDHAMGYWITDIDTGEKGYIDCDKIGIYVAQEKKKLRDKGLIP